MNELTGFSKVATYLTHPLVLVGFVLMLVFGVHRQLIKSGLLPKVTKETGGKILHTMLKYGFWIGFTVVILGFVLQFLQPS